MVAPRAGSVGDPWSPIQSCGQRRLERWKRSSTDASFPRKAGISTQTSRHLSGDERGSGKVSTCVWSNRDPWRALSPGGGADPDVSIAPRAVDYSAGPDGRLHQCRGLMAFEIEQMIARGVEGDRQRVRDAHDLLDRT